ncbi:N-acetylneuraminate synthase family protein, partial [Oleiphilus sp. HI0043]
MNNQFKIGNALVGDNLKPYIIAEIGVNHEGSMELAKRLIDEAKAGGAHAAKFQSYKASKIASKHSPAYWDQSKEPTDSQFKLFQKYDNFETEQYEELADYCQSIGIDFMSTPFDLDAVDFLDPLIPAF